jgi:AcrR family transcriptional regulator
MSPPRRRRPSSPGAGEERKSDRTRSAILASAREQFADQPYDKASLRAIAAQAGVDPAMILRYFTNKESLFAAAVDIDLHLPDLREVPVRRRGEVFAQHFIEVWEGPERNEALPILLRSAVAHEQAAQRLQEILSSQVRRVIADASGPADAGARAGLVSSQLLGLAMARYVLHLPGVAELTPDQVERRVGPTLQRYLTGDVS